MTIWHWDEAHCIYRVTNTFYSVSCDAVSTIQIIVKELILFLALASFIINYLQNKPWKFCFFLKSSFSPIENSTCKRKQYFYTSWPELFIFEDLVFMPRLYGLWILPQSQMQSDREEEESALCSIRGWWAGYLIEYIFFSPLWAQRILDSLSHPG